MARFYDVDEGAVRLSGVDVRDLSFASLRATVGMVPQDGHLFHDTIRANLLLARPQASEEELWEALRRARAADLVAALPDGLDTVWVSVVTAFPAGNANGSPLPGCCWLGPA